MSNITRINRSLHKQFGGRFCVVPQQQHLSLQGESDNWHAIVQAGRLAAVLFKGEGGVVNDVHYIGEQAQPTRLPAVQDNTLDGQAPDVLVIGGGVIGCAIARELARYQMDVMLVEKECDVAMHASSRNDGMVHPGLDLKHKNTQKHHYNHRGNAMFKELCAELQVPFKRSGQYLCFPQPRWLLWAGKFRWNSHGIPSRFYNQKQLRRRLPHIHPALKCGMFFPTAGAVCPYTLTIAYAENAIENGVRVHLNTAVLGMDVHENKIIAVHTNRGTLKPKLVINAAGVFCEDIAAFAQDRFFSIHPRRGTNIILDTKFSKLMSRSASTLGTGAKEGYSKHTKGGGVIHTVHGNLLLGPNAVETIDKEDFATHAQDLRTVFGHQTKTSEALHPAQGITYFSGTRAATFEEDFVVRRGLYTKNIIHAAGMQSPGLTAAPAVAVDVAQWAADMLQAQPNEDFNPQRQGIVDATSLNNFARNTLIRQSPDYGIILCRCEQISKGEILAAMRRPLPCDSIDGIKRRVRAGMGRCQGGFCCPLITQVIADELGIPLDQVRKTGEGSELLCGEIKPT
ncbi:MAG: FAD-dependent oxidoreductase [Oscillospiraceae bacterium]|nr:FAD-dependent oxidoreductase [Oscillospiraceae bacterium]